MNNAQRFLDAYAVIEHALAVIVNDSRYVPFQQLLFKAQKHSWIVSKNLQELREYGELRNALVHLRDGNNEVIAEPTDKVTEDIEHLAKLLSSDDNVMQYISKPVKIVSPEDSILGAYELMRTIGSSKLPVYEGNLFKGLIKVEAICSWAIQRSKATMIKDLLDPETKKYVTILDKHATVQDVMNAYEEGLQSGVQLLGILVTEHGSEQEIPLGIITAQDLPEILQAFL